MTDDKGETGLKQAHFDIIVFHPVYDSIDHKRTFLEREGMKWLKIDFIPKKMEYPVIVSVFKNKKEAREGIPIDLVELKSRDEVEWLSVPSDDNFILVLFDKRRKRTSIK